MQRQLESQCYGMVIETTLAIPNRIGHLTWFIMPKEVALAYAQNLKNSKMENIIRASTDDPFA